MPRRERDRRRRCSRLVETVCLCRRWKGLRRSQENQFAPAPPRVFPFRLVEANGDHGRRRNAQRSGVQEGFCRPGPRRFVPDEYDPDKSVMICRNITRTGSRLPKKRCKTAAQMKREAAHRKDALKQNSSRIPRAQPSFKFPDQ